MLLLNHQFLLSEVCAFVFVVFPLVVVFPVVVEEHDEHEHHADPDTAKEPLKHFISAPSRPFDEHL